MFFGRLKIQLRLMLLLTLVVGLSVAMVGIQWHNSQKRISEYFRAEEKEARDIFEKILTLKGEALATLASDYTIWDEMLNFVRTGDISWAKINIDSALSTFKANAAWIYGTDLSLKYAVNDLEDDHYLESPFPKSKELFAKLFQKNGLCHFFVNTPRGLWEIRGATIHPSADNARETPAGGYFFAGDLWDEKFTQNLSNLYNGKIFLSSQAMSPRSKDEIFFSTVVKDWMGRPVQVISAQIQVPLADELTSGFEQNLVIQIVFLLATLLIVLIALNRWVTEPLQAISEALTTDNISPLDFLNRQEGEFSDIAGLIVKFIEQRQKLIEDMAARKAAETALVQSEERFRNIAEASGEWIWETDSEGRYTYSSGVVKKLLGYSPQEMTGRYYYEFFASPAEGAAEVKAHEGLLPKTTFFRRERKSLHKDGHLVILETTAVPVLGPEGNFLGYRGIDRDITEEQERRRENLETTLQLRTIINAVDEGIIFSDNEGHFFVYNSKMEEITGYSMEEANRSGDFLRLLCPDQRKYHEAMSRLGDIAQGKVLPETETQIQTKGGQQKSVLVRTRKLFIKNMTMFLTVYRDVTMRRQMGAELVKVNEELRANERALKNILFDLKKSNDDLRSTQSQLVQSEKMSAVGQLSAGIAHEIKNPLSIILLSVDSLESHSEKLDEKERRKLGMIRNSAERANKIVGDLLKFSRYSTLDLKKQNLIPIIEDAISLIQNTAVIKQVEVNKDFSADTAIPIDADQILLQQVFLNLFGNALDAMDDGGVLDIKIRLRNSSKDANKQEVVVDIRDTGGGIAGPILHRIFEPFFTTKEPGKGTGLGLSIVYMIVERHGGRIDVESQEGEGTRFSVVLPLAKTDKEKTETA